ncbi:MAG: MarR family winged helix-turn-helix transcriptional regulator [Arthrobacter sp.]|uniref:MarR family winged helix-turn-helix transcriptional regulator n=1 Tax=unclassified Arthrobacter TaxID=235627 RepID=UPI00264DDD4A|nr:MarR family transcriptional regulator [Micrococcaceae bacterium]MDN5811771.1 MarR family transcriptional regulator [Micrococcaceae bacterium]MDN5823295.1 MarR family transcriptional regulator [Micrococcaceae bacterium]MDN5879093.1 MarR family transcriptional regulator [Micrococcaceae bacterium]MDN5887314.1 MarR family transcriptional regulator [Micrococcaceae bacterium]
MSPNAPEPVVDDDLAVHLRVAIMRVSRRLRVDVGAGAVTAGQYSVLICLGKEPRTLGQLAERERVQAPSMTRIAKALEEQGYVERRTSPEDGRQVLIAITDAGRAIVEDVRGQRTAWLSRHVAELGPADRAVLGRAAELLKEMNAW